MKWLKIVGLGITIWFLTLIWFELNELLTSPLMFGLIIGLAVILPVYLFGKWLGQQYHSGENIRINYPTRSDRAVVFARHHHSLPTRPMPAIQQLHSQPTRPMSITIYR